MRIFTFWLFLVGHFDEKKNNFLKVMERKRS